MKRKYLITASILMILVGLLRGLGGVILILDKNKVTSDPSDILPKTKHQ